MGLRDCVVEVVAVPADVVVANAGGVVAMVVAGGRDATVIVDVEVATESLLTTGLAVALLDTGVDTGVVPVLSPSALPASFPAALVNP